MINSAAKIREARRIIEPICALDLSPFAKLRFIQVFVEAAIIEFLAETGGAGVRPRKGNTAP